MDICFDGSLVFKYRVLLRERATGSAFWIQCWPESPDHIADDLGEYVLKRHSILGVKQNGALLWSK